MSPVDDLVVERILRAVECVPTGRVVTYGDIAGSSLFGVVW